MSKIELDPIGFHGDKFLIKFLNLLKPYYDVFIETGTHIGSSSLYYAKNNKDKEIYTCEKNNLFYSLAKKKLSGYSNVHVFNESSPDFLKNIKVDKRALYYLDSHWEKYWPLEDELKLISSSKDSGIILIDDAKVPDESFQYDIYEDKVCDLNFLIKTLNTKNKYNIFFPKYKERTSEFHPKIGYFFIIFGFDFDLEEYIVEKFITDNFGVEKI